MLLNHSQRVVLAGCIMRLRRELMLLRTSLRYAKRTEAALTREATLVEEIATLEEICRL